MQEQTTPTLTQKLALIMRELKNFPKTATNDSGPRFRFAEVSDMLETIRPMLAEAGVMLWPEQMEPIYVETTTKSGSTMVGCRVIVTWAISDGSETIHMQTLGESWDSSDKASNKAQTAAQKQALQKLFAVGSEDPDHESPAAGSSQRSAGPRRQQPDQPSQVSKPTLHNIEAMRKAKGLLVESLLGYVEAQYEKAIRELTEAEAQEVISWLHGQPDLSADRQAQEETP